MWCGHSYIRGARLLLQQKSRKTIAASVHAHISPLFDCEPSLSTHWNAVRRCATKEPPPKAEIPKGYEIQADTEYIVDTPDQVLRATKKWVDTIVIREQFCPFVEPLRLADRIRFVVSPATSMDEAVEDFLTEAKLLLPNHEVIPPPPSKLRPDQDYREEEQEDLIVDRTKKEKVDPPPFACTLISFDGQFVQTSENFDLLCDQIYGKIIIDLRFFQELSYMTFHPNMVNYYEKQHKLSDETFFFALRSPYPTMLLVPFTDMKEALKTPNIEELTLTNRFKCMFQGVHTCYKRLVACYVPLNEKTEDGKPSQ